MANIASLAVQLTANTGPFRRKMIATIATVGKFRRSIAAASRRVLAFGAVMARRVARSMIRFTALAVAAGVAITVFAVKSAAAAIDNTAKLSKRLGIATEQFTRLQHIASLTGVETTLLEKGITKMTASIAEASKGTGEAIEAFRDLGLDLENLSRLSPDKQFLKIAEAMAKVKKQGDQVQITGDIFGLRGIKILNTLQELRNGMSELADEADRAGVTFSAIDAAKVEAMNDSLGRVKLVLTGIANQLAIQVSPFVTALADQFFEAATSGEDMGAKVTNAMEGMALSVGVVLDTVQDVGLEMGRVTDFIQRAAGAWVVAFNAWGFVIDSLKIKLNDLKDALPPAVSRFLGRPAARIRTTAQVGRVGADAIGTVIGRGFRLKPKREVESISSQIRKTFAEIRERAQIAAEESAAKAGTFGTGELEERIVAQEKLDKLHADGKSLMESLRTPLERYNDELKKFAALAKAGAISQETLTRARRQSNRQLLSEIGITSVGDVRSFAQEVQARAQGFLRPNTSVAPTFGGRVFDVPTLQPHRMISQGEAQEEMRQAQIRGFQATVAARGQLPPTREQAERQIALLQQLLNAELRTPAPILE